MHNLALKFFLKIYYDLLQDLFETPTLVFPKTAELTLYPGQVAGVRSSGTSTLQRDSSIVALLNKNVHAAINI